MRHALLLIALATVAHADPQAARKAAEDLEREAKQTKDPSKFVACGHAYLDVYKKYAHVGTDGDEPLYNAAVCFTEGKSIGAALQSLELLMRAYPQSRLAPRALARAAKTYGDILQFDRAAERLEEYARKYAGEKDAYFALSDAILYRHALGDRARAIANTRYFVKMFGRKKPREATEAMLSLIPLHDGDELIAHLGLVLRAHRLTDGQKATVLTKLGDALSAQSCPVPLRDGLCIKLERARGAKRCATDGVRITAPRRKAQHAEALAAYKASAKLFDRRPDDALARYHAVMAKLALADAELEKLLARPAPKGNPEAWLRDATSAAKAVTDRYEAIIALREPYAAIVATARMGQAVQALWRTLRDTRATKDGCTTVDALAAPLATRAGDLFDVCLQKAAQLGVHDAYTRLCLREAQAIDATRFPPRDVQPHPAAITIAIPMVADNNGEPYWRAGRRAVAIKAWQAALVQNSKLFEPRINIAIARHEELRAMRPGDPARKALASDITVQLQNAAAVERHPAPLVVLGTLALDDKKLELADMLFASAVREDDKYAPAHVALGVLAVRRDRWSAALGHFERAMKLDPTSESALLGLALASLRVGRHDAAADALARIKTATYDVELARGVAARGQGKLAEARAAYERAAKLDASRTEAQQNLRTIRGK